MTYGVSSMYVPFEYVLNKLYKNTPTGAKRAFNLECFGSMWEDGEEGTEGEAIG